MPNWEGIMIHCSATPDQPKKDWSAIRRYHTTPKPDGNGWSDIGYHYGVEDVGGFVEVLWGREGNRAGAHCRGYNAQFIGVCVVGDYDNEEPSDTHYDVTARLCATLCENYGWDESVIVPHRDYSDSGKTCPGKKFDMDKLRDMVFERLQK